MASIAQAPKKSSIVHEHRCGQCGQNRLCEESSCAPSRPGVTELLCNDCAAHPKTLLDVRKELMDGSNDLYAGLLASIVEQESLTPEQQEQVQQYLADPLAKRDRLADFILSLEEEAERLRGRVRMLEERARQFATVARMFRSSIVAAFSNGASRTGIIVKANGSEHSFSVRQNPAKVQIINLDDIPGKYITYTPQPDLRAIKDALERGETVPGAQLGDKTHSLIIR